MFPIWKYFLNIGQEENGFSQTYAYVINGKKAGF